MGVAQYAEHRGCALYAVQYAIQRGRIRLDSNNLIDSDAADRDWEANTELTQARPGPKPKADGSQVAHGGSPGEPAKRATEAVPGIPYTDARALREVYDAQRKLFDLERRRGEYVRADEVRQEAFKAYRRFRDMLLTIPARIAAQLAAEREEAGVRAILEAEITAVLQAFAEGKEAA